MTILYTMRIDRPYNPGRDVNSPTNWPTDIDNSDWLKTVQDAVVKKIENDLDNDLVRTVYQKTFESQADLDAWIAANRLTDPTLIALMAEWDSAHNFTRTEITYELTETSRSGLLG